MDYDELISKLLKKERKVSSSNEKTNTNEISKVKNCIDLMTEDNKTESFVHNQAKNLNFQRSGKIIPSLNFNSDKNNESFISNAFRKDPKLDEKIPKNSNSNINDDNGNRYNAYILSSNVSRKNETKTNKKDSNLITVIKKKIEETDKVLNERMSSINKKDKIPIKLNLKSNNSNVQNASTSRISSNLSCKRENLKSSEKNRDQKSKSKEKDIPSKIVKKIQVNLNSNINQTKNEKHMKKYMSNLSINKNVTFEKKDSDINSILRECKNPPIASKIFSSSIKTPKEIKQKNVIDLSDSNIPPLNTKKQLIGTKIVALDLITQRELDSNKVKNTSISSLISNIKTCTYDSDSENASKRIKGIVSLHEARKNKNLDNQHRSFSEDKYSKVNKLQLVTENLRKSSENSPKKYESASSLERDHVDKKNNILRIEEKTNNLRSSSLETTERNFYRSNTLRVLSERRFKYKIQKLIDIE